jgi:hypothetical protein
MAAAGDDVLLGCLAIGYRMMATSVSVRTKLMPRRSTWSPLEGKRSKEHGSSKDARAQSHGPSLKPLLFTANAMDLKMLMCS